MKKDLSYATAETIRRALSASSDGMVRVDLSIQWPVPNAVTLLAEGGLAPLVGVMAPFSSRHFADSGAHIEDDPARLTALRNSRVGGAPKVFDALVLVGSARGAGTSGLRRISQVITRTDVARVWRDVLRKEITSTYDDEPRRIRLDVALFLTESLSLGKIQPAAAEEYANLLVAKDRQLNELQEGLYLLGLMPDESLIGSNDRIARLRQNSSLLEEIAGGLDGNARLRRLAKCTKPKVASIVRWSASHADEDLRDSEYSAVLAEIRGGGKKAKRPDPGEPGPASEATLLEFLGDPDISEEVRRAVLDEVTDKIGANGHRRGRLDVEVVRDGYYVRLDVAGDIEPESAWLEDIKANQDEPVTAPDPQVLLVIEGVAASRGPKLTQAFREPAIRKRLATPGDELDDYLNARKMILTSARLLACEAEDLLTLLVACPSLRVESLDYINAWEGLLRAILDDANEVPRQHKSLAALLDGIWTRGLLPEEVNSQLTLNWTAPYDRVTLAPWHPWRLKPLVDLAQEIVNAFEANPEIVRSALWALDRAVPAYRILEIPPTRLQYSTVERGSLLFSMSSTEGLPPSSGSGGLLSRAVAAYAKAHPWSSAGASMALANPPRGSLARSLVRSARSAFGHHPALLLMRQRGLAGILQTDDLPNLISSVDVDRLADLAAEGHWSRDLSFVFMPGPSGQFMSAHTGAHGAIALKLKSRGLNVDGDETFVPEIVVGAGDKNSDLITLPYAVAGAPHVTTASYELVLNEEQLNQLQGIAGQAGWTIVAIPGSVSAFDLKKSDGSPMIRVAEFDEGRYRCFVYAQTLEPLEWLIGERLRQLPVDPEVRTRLGTLLGELAHAQPQKLFDVAQNRFGPDECLGIIAARQIAISSASADDLVLEVSLDDTSWTQHWFEDRGQRADFLIVTVSPDPNAAQPVRIVAVEAKATSDPYASPSPSAAPFAEAVQQVEATREQLLRLVSSQGSLISTLRFRAFTEQIAAAAAYAYTTGRNQEHFPTYFQHLTDFARTPDKFIDNVEGLVVSLYTSGQQRSREGRFGETRLVSCSARLLERVLTGGELEEAENVDVAQGAPPIALPTSQFPAESMHHEMFTNRSQDDSSSVAYAQDAAISAKPPAIQYIQSTELGERDGEVFANLMAALRIRSQDVGGPEQARVFAGPTFLTVSLPLLEGASLAPLKRAEDDIARDIGVQQIDIGNDRDRGRIRVLIPRPERLYPALPLAWPDVDGATDYLPLFLGQDVFGVDRHVPLSQWPHALIAGSTGSGKTTFLRSLLKQLDRRGPREVKCIIVDGKGESDYFGVIDDRLYVPEFTDPQISPGAAVDVLKWLVTSEVPRRKELVVDLAKRERRRVDARVEYRVALQSEREPLMQPLFVVIDEFNEIMLKGGSDKQGFVDGVTSIAQAGRSVMVHLVLATQRPEKNVLPGVIKANLPTRIALRLPTASDSLTVLGHGGAERLLGNGDLLLQIHGHPDVRLQGYAV